MKIMKRQNNRLQVKIAIIAVLTAFAFLCFCAGTASAIVYHGTETISDDTTWAEDVHVINASCYIYVKDDVTLTIPAGER